MTTLLLALLPLSLFACGDKDDDTGEHTGTHDGGTHDGGTMDGGAMDGGTMDGGTMDGGATGDGGTASGLEIVGTWLDDWGTTHVIGETTWDQGYALFNISQYDNDGGFLVAQNDEGNKYSPGLWSRFDWTWDGTGKLWYCQTAYDAGSEEGALSTPAPDATDPASGGCGGFSWTGMSAAR